RLPTALPPKSSACVDVFPSVGDGSAKVGRSLGAPLNARESLADPSAVGCPTSSMLVQFVDRESSGVDAAAIEAHVADCSHCREFTSAMLLVGSSRSDLVSSMTDTLVIGDAAWGAKAGSLPGDPSAANRYTLLERIGEGAMGIVHAAYDTALKRKV